MNLLPDRRLFLNRGYVSKAAIGALPALALGLTLSLSGCAHAPVETPSVTLDYPSPLSGPGAPLLDQTARDQILNGFQALARGDVAAAREYATAAGDGPAGHLLRLQAATTDGAANAVPDLEKLTESDPAYASAWLTLSVAAERAGNEFLALESAAKGAEIWPDQRWTGRAERLQTVWVDDRVADARTLYGSDELDQALAALAPARAANPNDHSAVLLETEILISLGEFDRAEVVLSSLPRDADAVLLSGSLAEARGDRTAAMRIYASLPNHPGAVLKAIDIAESEGLWQMAMDLYATLPDESPEKEVGLRRAKLRWRISVMPEYVQEAVHSKDLNRAGLAVLLITIAPKVETLPGGQVPLLSDIMRQPAQREILTAVRHGLVGSDRLEHRYHPNSPASANEVQQSITTLAALLSVDAPLWCGDEVASPCMSIEEPIAGAQVADIVIDVVTREGS